MNQTASEQNPFEVMSQEDAFKTMRSAECAMNAFVANIVKRENIRRRSPLEPFEITESEKQVLNYLKEKFKEAERAWHEAAKREHDARAEEHDARAEEREVVNPECLFIGGTNDGRRMRVEKANSVWLFPLPCCRPGILSDETTPSLHVEQERYTRMTFRNVVFYVHSSLGYWDAIELLFKHYKQP